MADLQSAVDVMVRKGISPRALQVMLFIDTPRRPQTIIDELDIDRGTLNQIVRRNAEYMTRRTCRDLQVSRNRGKKPIEYHLTAKGKRLLKSLSV